MQRGSNAWPRMPAIQAVCLAITAWAPTRLARERAEHAPGCQRAPSLTSNRGRGAVLEVVRDNGYATAGRHDNARKMGIQNPSVSQSVSARGLACASKGSEANLWRNKKRADTAQALHMHMCRVLHTPWAAKCWRSQEIALSCGRPGEALVLPDTLYVAKAMYSGVCLPEKQG